MPKGGKREGAGRPKGTTGIQHASTITKAQAREALREYVISQMPEMMAAQVAHAKGIKYLVARNKAGGKFEKVSPEQLDAMLAGQDDGSIILEVWDKDPSVQAFTDLMNRALDKPAEQEQTINVTGQIDFVAVLRERHAKRLQSQPSGE